MLIKFKKPDPRAGMTARMDSSRGQFFVDNGCADKVSENGDAIPPAPAPAPEQEQEQEQERDLPSLAAAFIAGTVPEVTGRIDGADKDLLEAALAAENTSEKPRKGVVDALTSALTPQA